MQMLIFKKQQGAKLPECQKSEYFCARAVEFLFDELFFMSILDYIIVPIGLLLLWLDKKKMIKELKLE